LIFKQYGNFVTNEINSDDEEDFIDTTFEDILIKIQKKIFLIKNTEEGVINEKFYQTLN
jgi:hypothetical protein